MTSAQAQPAATELTDIGPVEDFPVGRLVMIEFAEHVIGIIRTAGGIRAIGNRCPHQGGPICRGIVTGTMAPSSANEYIYEKDGEIIRCPWHGYEFELSTGKSVGSVVRGRVPVYTVEERGGRVYFALQRASLPDQG
jgi:nitrite reductase (NADH) small subunit